ncbi:hypothetical protein FEM48_Zijuj09G0201600 [Ziziphus jujuba var. spinosa]|uniref:NB-ARC domain-containing protein n=1 Tax=Ziziphus jujuba var. spinosa TaxID=714518 RepID=A0A978UV25_ZIZJJ|nr:hypothetical protein FEM48_Zijuj09G0201600 [Ziziphus jujuba var. spinosa]
MDTVNFPGGVGPDGIGKSALAQFVFSDDRINAHFDLPLWVPVLDDFDALRMTRTLLEGLTCQHPCNPREEEDASRLQARLKDALAGKNFLLVLDSNCNRNPFDHHALGILSEFGVPESGRGRHAHDRSIPLFIGRQIEELRLAI